MSRIGRLLQHGWPHVGASGSPTDKLWVCADATTGLHKVPHHWAGVFVLEAARFLHPAQHFALIDNDCAPVTLFEVQDPLQLAHQQHQWIEAFAAPLSNLFAFVKNGHPACPFITHKQLALYANPRFWQYGLLAFIARCCSYDNQHRHQGSGPEKVEQGKCGIVKMRDASMSELCALCTAWNALGIMFG